MWVCNYRLLPLHRIRISTNGTIHILKTRKKDELKAAHDEAMFGAPSLPPEEEDEDEEENTKKETNETAPAISLLSDQVRDFDHKCSI